MKTFKKTLMEIHQPELIICNMCGENIEKNEFGYFEEHLSIEKNWGYSSIHDGENHNIDLCQKCYEKLLQSLKIKPNSQS